MEPPSDIPEDARPFLQYLPVIAEYIRKDRRPSRGELSLLRMFAPEAFRRLKSLDYEDILQRSAPFASHPEYSEYVALVRTEKAKRWIEDVLTTINSM